MNLESLIQPLAQGKGGCGEDLAFSVVFDEIHEARRFDDPSLSQGEWVTDIKEADWPAVVRLCEQVLAERSKDLRVAAWRAEAKFRLAGLPGLSDGFQLVTALCERYWDDLHPLPENGELEERAGAFDWLLMQTERLLKRTPLTQSTKGAYTLLDHEQALAASKTTADEAAEAGNRVSLEQFDAAVRATPKAFFAAGMQQVDQFQADLNDLKGVLEARMAALAPSFRPCFEVLADIRNLFSRHAGSQAAKLPEAGAVPGTAANAAPVLRSEGGRVAEALPAGPVQSREQAMRQLREIAAFFRETEPHSPVAYLADKAVKWGSMPLHEWLRAVLKEEGALVRIEELLGIEVPTTPDND